MGAAASKIPPNSQAGLNDEDSAIMNAQFDKLWLGSHMLRQDEMELLFSILHAMSSHLQLPTVFFPHNHDVLAQMVRDAKWKDDGLFPVKMDGSVSGVSLTSLSFSYKW